jgi:hypothetical protein
MRMQGAGSHLHINKRILSQPRSLPAKQLLDHDDTVVGLCPQRPNAVVRSFLTRVSTRTPLCFLSSPGQVILVSPKLGIVSNLVHNKNDEAAHHVPTFARQVLTKTSWRIFPLSNLSNYRVNTMVQLIYRSNRVRLFCYKQSTCALTSISVMKIRCRCCLMYKIN